MLMRIISQKQEKKESRCHSRAMDIKTTSEEYIKSITFSMLTEILLLYETSKSIALYASLVGLFFQ